LRLEQLRTRSGVLTGRHDLAVKHPAPGLDNNARDQRQVLGSLIGDPASDCVSHRRRSIRDWLKSDYVGEREIFVELSGPTRSERSRVWVPKSVVA
jgi:hypothetical protein